MYNGVHSNNEAIELLERAADRADAMLEMAELTATDARAIARLLKEHEAAPVTQREVMHMLVWCCGSCGVAITDGDKFCRMCGKALKWNG